ncbi:MAG TPA: hypothetical protein VF997_08080, partial [Polyangia bacterium]
MLRLGDALMFRLGFAIALAGVALPACGGSTPPNPLIVARPYDFDEPAGIDKSKPAPLIVLLHGYSANGFAQDAYFGFMQLANDHGVYVAHPDGLTDSKGAKFWNATDACCDFDHTGV